jgi:prenylcysteine oxidase/farnesylcysteine lyase
MSHSGNLKLAIIGTGIAGSAAAYFARKEFGQGITISVFERDSRVGGRMEHRPFAGTIVETGGTLLHSTNAYAAGMMDELGLRRALPQDRDGSGSETVGIWNGETVSFQTSKYQAITAMKLMGRYGLSAIRMGRAVKAEVDRWTRIYELQRAGKAYSTPEEMFTALGLYKLCREPSLEFFRLHRIGDLFVREFVDGISRNNYGQDSRLHAFANVVSLAGAGFAGGNLFSIEGGNSKLCELLLRSAGVQLNLNAAVRTIRSADAPSNGYSLTIEGGGDLVFDAVIIATPLETASIELNVPQPHGPIIVDRPFQVTHATFIAGNLNEAFFGAAAGGHLPGTILTAEGPDIWFSSVGRVGFSPTTKTPVYKVFSREALSDAQIRSLFRFTSEIERVVWRAYPVLLPSISWPAFELAKGLYYPNAMESAVSTIETEAVAARNVVGLIQKSSEGLAIP